MGPELAIDRATAAGVPLESLALYGRWWQLEVWLRQLSYFTLRAAWGSTWESELDKRAKKYASNDGLIHLIGPDQKDLLGYLDFSLLLKVIGDNWGLFEHFLLERGVWDGRTGELRAIRNRVGHLRRAGHRDRDRIELTLQDLEHGFREALRALVSRPVSASERMDDAVLAAFGSTRSELSRACAHARNKYGFEIDLTVSTMPWADLADAPSPVSGTPGAIWHLSIGGPDRWLDPQCLSRIIQQIREQIIYVFAGAPVGAQLAMPAVDDAPQVVDAMVHFVENYGSCTVPIAKVATEDADAWPGDTSAIDSRILADHLFAIAQSPDDPGTPFGV